jgi:ribonuclease HII
MILGIDEAGRGPWAGPLVVGAVILGGAVIDGLTDSKKLTKNKREVLYGEIVEKALAYASGWVSAAELDEAGMSEALRLATRRAVEQIKAPYSEIIIDGTINFLKDTGKGKYVQTMPKADLLVPSVSAASIIAKVERDRYMTALDETYPGYGFKSHAGYGVAAHREAIDRQGVTPEHRLSFAPLIQYQSRPLPSSQISEKSARRSLPAGPVGMSTPSSEKSKISSEAGVATHAATRLTTKIAGDTAETVVAKHLSEGGHVILERNWRTKFCEIDIVSQKGDTIYFVEVKYRKNDKAGGGLAAITPKKLKQMTFAAEFYSAKHRLKDVNLRLAAADVSGEVPTLQSYLELG